MYLYFLFLFLTCHLVSTAVIPQKDLNATQNTLSESNPIPLDFDSLDSLDVFENDTFLLNQNGSIHLYKNALDKSSNMTERWTRIWKSRFGKLFHPWETGVLASLLSFVHSLFKSVSNVVQHSWPVQFITHLLELGIHPEIISKSVHLLLKECQQNTIKCLGFTGTQLALALVAFSSVNRHTNTFPLLEKLQHHIQTVQRNPSNPQFKPKSKSNVNFLNFKKMKSLSSQVDLCLWNHSPLCDPLHHQLPPRSPKHLVIHESNSFLNVKTHSESHSPCASPSSTKSHKRLKRDFCSSPFLRLEHELQQRAWQCEFEKDVFHVMPDHVIDALAKAPSRGQFVTEFDRIKYNLHDDKLPKECQGQILEHSSVSAIESQMNFIGKTKVDILRIFWVYSPFGKIFCGVFQHPDDHNRLDGYAKNQYIPCKEI